MADNSVVTPGTGENIASDELTYSGDTAKIQVVRQVHVTGAEGSKALVEVWKLEDAAHTSGDPGIQMLAIRQDTASTGLGADGDYAPPRLDANGRLQVVVGASASHDVTNAGTFATQVSSIAAGDNNIGNVDIVTLPALAAGTNNIGDVDVLSVVPGTGATSLGKAIDSAGGSTDTGVAILAIRDDALTTLTPVDGDWVPLRVSSTGALHVVGSAGTTQYAEDTAAASGDSLVAMGAVRRDSATAGGAVDGDYVHLSTNSTGALRVTVDSATATSIKADDAAFTTGTDSVAVIGAVRDDSLSTLAAAEGDAVVLRVNSTGALHVTGGGGGTQYAEDAAHASGDTGTLALVVRRDTAAVSGQTDGDYSTLTVDSTGRLWCNVSNTVTVGSHAVTNAGTFATQVDGAALTALQVIDNPVVVDDAAFTPATTSVMMAGFEADESTTDSVDEGDAGAARMTLDRKQIVTLQPHTTGGLSTFMASGSDGSSILVATAQVIKASAGQLYGYFIYNPEAAVTFVHFYNTAAASVTVGTTNPMFTVAVPAGSAANLSLPYGITFSNAGWSCAATTTAGGNTAPATGASLVAWYL